MDKEEAPAEGKETEDEEEEEEESDAVDEFEDGAGMDGWIESLVLRDMRCIITKIKGTIFIRINNLLGEFNVIRNHIPGKALGLSICDVLDTVGVLVKVMTATTVVIVVKDTTAPSDVPVSILIEEVVFLLSLFLL
jgi:hypothetical protein